MFFPVFEIHNEGAYISHSLTATNWIKLIEDTSLLGSFEALSNVIVANSSFVIRNHIAFLTLTLNILNSSISSFGNLSPRTYFPSSTIYTQMYSTTQQPSTVYTIAISSSNGLISFPAFYPQLSATGQYIINVTYMIS
jgi:hypothetical protein